MKNKFYVYLYTDPITHEPVYVGKGKGKRAYAHFKLSTRLGNWLRKRELEGCCPTPQIFPQESEADALAMEIALIDWYGRSDLSTGTLFNLTDGGDGVANPSNQTRAKLSAAQKRRPPPSDETRAKISAANKNISDETRAKISAVHKGKIATKETKARMSAARRGMKLGPATEEHKKKNSESVKAWWAKRKEKQNANLHK